MPAISEGSPSSRRWSAARNQFQHLDGLASLALRRIDHQAVLFFCDEVHSGAGCEIVRRLGAAVEHDDQREAADLVIAAGDEELVGPASGLSCCRCLR